VKYGGFGFLIACTGVPAYWVYRCMDSLSGETTVLNMNVSIALNAVLGVSTTGLGAVVKYQRNLIKERDREIQKLKLELRAALADVSRIEKPPSV
jgi:hypothetical protein